MNQHDTGKPPARRVAAKSGGRALVEQGCPKHSEKSDANGPQMGGKPEQNVI